MTTTAEPSAPVGLPEPEPAVQLDMAELLVLRQLTESPVEGLYLRDSRKHAARRLERRGLARHHYLRFWVRLPIAEAAALKAAAPDALDGWAPSWWEPGALDDVTAAIRRYTGARWAPWVAATIAGLKVPGRPEPTPWVPPPAPGDVLSEGVAEISDVFTTDPWELGLGWRCRCGETLSVALPTHRGIAGAVARSIERARKHHRGCPARLRALLAEIDPDAFTTDPDTLGLGWCCRCGHSLTVKLPKHPRNDSALDRSIERASRHHRRCRCQREPAATTGDADANVSQPPPPAMPMPT